MHKKLISEAFPASAAKNWIQIQLTKTALAT